MMNYEAFYGVSKFYDAQSFPHGFARSGVFNKREAELLETTGRFVMKLVSGLMEPETQEERNFISVLRGDIQAEDELEKTWLKYFQSTQQPRKKFSALGGRPGGTDFSVPNGSMD